MPQLGELGFFGANLHGYGCAGMSNVAYGLVTQELERGDSGLRSFVSVQSALVMYPIYAYGSDAQKDKWLPLLHRQSHRLLRTDRAAVRLQSRRHADARGKKRRQVRPERRKNVDHQRLDRGYRRCLGQVRRRKNSRLPGGERHARIQGLGRARQMVAARFGDFRLGFSDCEIPEENLLPNVVGLKGPLGCLNQARYGIGWGALGAAMACYDTALQYAKTRKQFANKPIASHQLVQEKLAWMITEIVKGQLLALHVGRLKDQGKVDPAHISMLKMNNVAIALDTARKARDILGANGIVDDYCIMRHMNNLESVSTYEGTNDIHKLVIGERITGISAFI